MPAQIHAWPSAHGWTPENPLPADPEDGVDCTYKELSDDGEVIWVRAPRPVEAHPYYALNVRAIVVTAAAMEDRPEADVRAEVLATHPLPTPFTPPAS
jgi:hypothetical protein